MPKNNKSFSVVSREVPDIERTLPTSLVVKLKPPSLRGLTVHNEKT